MNNLYTISLNNSHWIVLLSQDECYSYHWLKHKDHVFVNILDLERKEQLNLSAEQKGCSSLHPSEFM